MLWQLAVSACLSGSYTEKSGTHHSEEEKCSKSALKLQMQIMLNKSGWQHGEAGWIQAY